MLNEIYNSFIDEANKLKGWQEINKNDIANLYLDNKKTEHSSIYAAALLCKYWYKVGLIWKNNSNSMTQEDCYWTVWDGIERAMDYAPWRDPNNALYGDPNGPDKAINKCIDSVRKTYYTFSNRDKRKINHIANCQSLDALYDSTEDYSLQLVEEYETLCTDNETENLHLDVLIEKLLKDNKLPEAIVVYNICFDDSNSTEIKGNKNYSYFNERKFVSILYSLNSVFGNYFALRYNLNKDEVNDCINKINNLSYNLLHKLIKKTLYVVSHNKDYNFF